MLPFPNMAAGPGGHPRAEEAPLPNLAGTSAGLPALRPRLAFREARAARIPREPASRWAHGPETQARDWARGDDVRRRAVPHARARALRAARLSLGGGALGPGAHS